MFWAACVCVCCGEECLCYFAILLLCFMLWAECVWAECQVRDSELVGHLGSSHPCQTQSTDCPTSWAASLLAHPPTSPLSPSPAPNFTPKKATSPLFLSPPPSTFFYHNLGISSCVPPAENSKCNPNVPSKSNPSLKSLTFAHLFLIFLLNPLLTASPAIIPFPNPLPPPPVLTREATDRWNVLVPPEMRCIVYRPLHYTLGSLISLPLHSISRT